MATTNVKRWGCHHCSKRFNTISHLDRHLDIHDPNGKVKREYDETKTDILHFSGCHKTFSCNGNLTIHFNTEHSANPVQYPCPLCGQEFKSKGNLDQHIRAHTTEKPHKCPTCGRSFVQMAYLRVHQVNDADFDGGLDSPPRKFLGAKSQ
ncbi:Zinc finger protein 30 [Folsomia candida]|uniref:Zinc finger protein 30 n=1 Tax=Folsomia candida TaxID=158441 RepID=A0A226E9J7_FOLCA|nr:Zinc finger protein 30 [Folsomia candida]